jgi:hypothetical protein
MVRVPFRESRRLVIRGRVGRESRRPAMAGPGPRVRRGMVTGAVVPRATGHVVTRTARPQAAGRGTTGVLPPPMRRPVTPGRSLGASLAAGAGGRGRRTSQLITSALPSRIQGPVTPGRSRRVRRLGTTALSRQATQAGAAGGRLLPVRTPAATGRSRGRHGTIPAPTGSADVNSPRRLPAAARTPAVRVKHGQCLAVGGLGAPGSPATRPAGCVTTTPTVIPRVAGPRPGTVAVRKRTRLGGRRCGAGDAGLTGVARPTSGHRTVAVNAAATVRGGKQPAGSWKAGWSREPLPRRPGASSTAAATSWSRARTTPPGRTVTPQATAAARGAACSAGAAATPTPSLIRTTRRRLPARHRRPRRSGLRAPPVRPSSLVITASRPGWTLALT